MVRAIALIVTLLIGSAGVAAAQTAASALIGSYVVTGTSADGVPYGGPSKLTISLEPSGALALTWGNGEYVGIGQLAGDVLAVASTAGKQFVIMLMKINADGSLSGRWWRKTDPGTKGTELWRKN